MAGVEAIPQSTTSTPIPVRPSMKACFNDGPVRRESVPIATCCFFLLFLSSQTANDIPNGRGKKELTDYADCFIDAYNNGQDFEFNPAS